MGENAVIFKGTKDGLTIILQEGVDFSVLREQLEDKVKSLKSFLRGSKTLVKFKGRELSDEETKELVDVLTQTGEVEILLVADGEQEPIAVTPRKIMPDIFDGLQEGPTKFHKGTLRSGQSINYFGNVVVIGDVNPGAEIIAAGNVIILGILRGLVHAGAPDNKEAFVVALNLQPTQLRIGDIITRSPENEVVKGVNPEIAAVKDDMIYIDKIVVEK